MRPVNNDIVNGNVVSTSNNVINNNVDKYARAIHNSRQADILLEKLGLTETSKGFMWKVVDKLSESRIQQHVESAQKAKKSKIGLFIYLCKQDGV